MLDVALKFLTKQLNAYLLSRTGSPFGEVEIGRLVDDSGKWAVKEDHVGAALINVEREVNTSVSMARSILKRIQPTCRRSFRLPGQLQRSKAISETGRLLSGFQWRRSTTPWPSSHRRYLRHAQSHHPLQVAPWGLSSMRPTSKLSVCSGSGPWDSMLTCNDIG